jgi:AcrR family transcriptional regulator
MTTKRPVDLQEIKPSENRTERRRREVFERLIEASRKLMFTRALDDATVQEITDMADLGKGTFFNYFPSKEHIVPALVRERMRQLAKMIEQVKLGQLSARKALVTQFTTIWRQQSPAESWFTFYSSFLRSLTHNEEIREAVAERNEVYIHHFEALVAIGQERGEFRTDYTATTLSTYINRLMFGLGIVSWIAQSAPGVREGDTLMELIIESIAAPAAGRRRKSMKKTGSRKSPTKISKQ